MGSTAYVRYCDFLPWEVIPSFLAACDILVYPAPKSNHPFFQRDTSPLKIFEYMAARKPIVMADLPPLRDILSEATAFLCEPGDPESLADAIERALKHPEEAQAKAERAWEIVQEHTWEKRMRRIMGKIQQR
jgi:glycosyltransferase involved in cell wall biosynthesis